MVKLGIARNCSLLNGWSVNDICSGLVALLVKLRNGQSLLLVNQRSSPGCSISLGRPRRVVRAVGRLAQKASHIQFRKIQTRLSKKKFDF